MNNEEARFLLSAYRPDGDDASDPRFAEALAQAERDPTLAAWFAQQRQFDATFAEALRRVPLPADLRARILAGGAASRPRARALPRAVLLLAAAVMLSAGGLWLWFQRAPGLDFWQRDALALIPKFGAGAEHFDLQDNDPAVLQSFLRAQNAPAPAAMPVALQAFPALGCKTIRSRGHAVSVLCFRMRPREFIHLVVTDEKSLTRPPPPRPRFIEVNGWKTASWSAHGQACMLATTTSTEDLRAVLGSAALAARAGEGFVRATNPRWLAAASSPRLP